MPVFHVRLMALGLAALLALVAQPAQAQLGKPGRNSIAAQLVAETDTPAPGSIVTLAIRMVPGKGWHGYWKNPGDAGVEPTIAWRLPPGVEAGPLQYPVPERLTIAGLMNYVYEGPYALLVELRLPSSLKPGAMLPLAARLDYLACTDRICVPEQADLRLDLTAAAAPAPPSRRAEFDAWRRAVPRPLASPARFEAAGDKVRLAVPLPASLRVEDVYFYPLTREAIAYAAPQRVLRKGDAIIVETSASGDVAGLATIDGLLRIGKDDGLLVTAKRGEVPAGGVLLSVPGQEAPGWRSIVLALAGAIVGGLLLNIMPCVFPILSLKALSLARAGGAGAEARREALAYTAGVILTCLALGGTLLALRAGGAAVGWAFQLQDPRVILLLLLLVTALALNLAGLFELPAITGGEALAARSGAGGAFWTGALAAFVATPCTGPFMGAALGAALVLPGPAAIAIFAGLGLGLALPFLALGFVPALRRRLPRPGAWMTRFRHILSVPMFLTALALAWVLSRQSGTAGLLLGIAATLLVGGALWWVGRRQSGDRAWLPLVPAVVGALTAVLLIPSLVAPEVAQAGAVLNAQPFSEGRLAALQSERRPVFVYFTADWCVTCKVNEKAVLARDEVARRFAAGNVAVLVGDWTRGDPAITRFLEEQGRSGVPLYLYYAPGKPVQALPQLLTVGTVTGLVGRP